MSPMEKSERKYLSKFDFLDPSGHVLSRCNVGVSSSATEITEHHKQGAARVFQLNHHQFVQFNWLLNDPQRRVLHAEMSNWKGISSGR